MNTVAEDDHSSVHSFSVIEDDQHSKAADDYKVGESETDESFHGEGCKLQAHYLHLKEKDQRENVDESFNSPSKEPSVVQVP